MFPGPVVLVGPCKSGGAFTYSANDTTRYRGKQERSRPASRQDWRLLRANACCEQAIPGPPKSSNSRRSKESFPNSVLLDCVSAKDLEIALLARDDPYRPCSFACAHRADSRSARGAKRQGNGPAALGAEAGGQGGCRGRFSQVLGASIRRQGPLIVPQMKVVSTINLDLNLIINHSRE